MFTHVHVAPPSLTDKQGPPKAPDRNPPARAVDASAALAAAVSAAGKAVSAAAGSDIASQLDLLIGDTTSQLEPSPSIIPATGQGAKGTAELKWHSCRVTSRAKVRKRTPHRMAPLRMASKTPAIYS